MSGRIGNRTNAFALYRNVCVHQRLLGFAIDNSACNGLRKGANAYRQKNNGSNYVFHVLCVENRTKIVKIQVQRVSAFYKKKILLLPISNISFKFAS